MKLKNIILALTLCFSQLVLADDSTELQNIIFKHDGLKADFSQTVTKADGSLVTKSSGDLALKRPDNFILNTTDPDEQVLFTKQNEVW
ncbi:MAG: outer membrane lipoprotein chaperone LolA, partial [Succinivibrio sp.]|nr:outer membrane lipoprotein chaperone LolA [Succinivibrio sp.]